MTTTELLKKVRQIEIKTKGLSDHIFAGEYHSAFKGRGMSFSEVREYVPGDDVKTIDWNVTARFSHPFVKVFEEERELVLMLLVDISSSSLFGTSVRTKRDLITEVGAVLSFSATTNNDKVGVIFFDDKVRLYIPPKKGKTHILRIIRDLLSLQPANTKETNVECALQFLNNVVKKRSVTFVLSDFISHDYERSLRVAARRHDVIGLKVYDPYDEQLPKAGLLKVSDSETGRSSWIDTSDNRLRNAYAKAFEGHNVYCRAAFQKSGAALLKIRTDQDYVKVLQSYFKNK